MGTGSLMAPLDGDGTVGLEGVVGGAVAAWEGRGVRLRTSDFSFSPFCVKRSGCGMGERVAPLPGSSSPSGVVEKERAFPPSSSSSIPAG